MYESFVETVWSHYHSHARSMPWREQPTLCSVLVSEIMLQQTQVDRVRPKYEAFLQTFKTVDDLAKAKLSDVLKQWQGLGYNRRAKFLHQAAKYIATNGTPQTFNQLVELPGVGKNTAGAIMNYVYNHPTPFVETNIRTVYFHHFYADHVAVSDTELLDMVSLTMDRENPREWFWALMDYGTWLKKQGSGKLTISRHYKKQLPLEGSVRQMRGMIIRLLTKDQMSYHQLVSLYGSDERFIPAFAALEREGLIERQADLVRLTD